MNIESIRSVLMAIELGSLSAVAKKIGVPTSTISRRIKDLETELGQVLLARSSRGIVAVEEAHLTLLRLKDVVHAIEMCHAPSSMKCLRVTAPTEIALSILPALLPTFLKEFPNVRVDVNGDNQTLGLVEAGFDLAIRTNKIKDSNLAFKKLSTSSFKLVCAHTLAKKINRVDQLGSVPFIQIKGPPPGLSGNFKGKPFDIHPPVIALLDTFSSAMPLLLEGQGVAQMPLHVVKDALINGQLKHLDQFHLKSRDVYALYPTRHRKQAAVQEFIKLVAQSLNAHQQMP